MALKFKLALLFFLTSFWAKAQLDTIYFSKAGDTILFSTRAGIPGSNPMTWKINVVKNNNKGDSLALITQILWVKNP